MTKILTTQQLINAITEIEMKLANSSLREDCSDLVKQRTEMLRLLRGGVKQ